MKIGSRRPPRFISPDTYAVPDCGASGAPALYLRGEKPAERLAEIMEQSFKMGGYVCVPLKFTRGKFLVQGSVNGRETHFILDTGGASTTVDLNQADNFQIQVREPLGRSVDIRARRTELLYGKVSSLSIGQFKLESFPVGIVDLGKVLGKKAESWPSVLGLVGPDLLGQARGLIDCGTGKLYLKPKQAK